MHFNSHFRRIELYVPDVIRVHTTCKTNQREELWFDLRRQQVQESVQSPTVFHWPIHDLTSLSSGPQPYTGCCTYLPFKNYII